MNREREREIPMTKQDESPYKGAAQKGRVWGEEKPASRRQISLSLSLSVFFSLSFRANNTIR